MRLTALTPREASIFACLTDTVVAPREALPPVVETDAVVFFDRWLARAPRLNRLGMRALLYAAEVAPRALGCPARLRRLDDAGRARALGGLDVVRSTRARQLAKLLRSMALLSYYGDDAVMRVVGYDAEANLRRARALREREGRP